jgi:hypothetical protein
MDSYSRLPIRYQLLTGEWDRLRHYVGQGLTNDDDLLTVRAYYLEGRVAADLTDGTFAWGGFLLDLVLALADRKPGSRQWQFYPFEQAATVEVRIEGPQMYFLVNRHPVGSLPVDEGERLIDEIVCIVLTDVRQRVPQLSQWLPSESRS